MLENADASSLQIAWVAPDTGGGAQTVAEYVITWDPENEDGVSTDTVLSSPYVIERLQSNRQYTVTVAASTADGQTIGATSDITPITGNLVFVSSCKS